MPTTTLLSAFLLRNSHGFPFKWSQRQSLFFHLSFLHGFATKETVWPILFRQYSFDPEGIEMLAISLFYHLYSVFS